MKVTFPTVIITNIQNDNDFVDNCMPIQNILT